MADGQQERVTNEGLASGPWRLEWFGKGSQLCVVDAGGTIVADFTNWMMSKAECERHARLLVQARNDLLTGTCRKCRHPEHGEHACNVETGQIEVTPPVPIYCGCV